MTQRDLYWRVTGIASLMLASGLSLLGERIVGNGIVLPAAMATLAGLSCFALACFGFLLVLAGARLRDRWIEAIRNGSAARAKAVRLAARHRHARARESTWRH